MCAKRSFAKVVEPGSPAAPMSRPKASHAPSPIMTAAAHSKFITEADYGGGSGDELSMKQNHHR